MIDRRRIMMQEASASPSGTLYPLPDVDDGVLKISNGNHVVFNGLSDSSSGFINLSSGTYSKSSDIINYKPLEFTIPARSNVQLIVDMITFNRAVRGNQWAANYRNANSNTSGGLGTGNKTAAETVTVDWTPGTNANVGCFFLYLTDMRSSCEFTISLYVDGVQYI